MTDKIEAIRNCLEVMRLNQTVDWNAGRDRERIDKIQRIALATLDALLGL